MYSDGVTTMYRAKMRHLFLLTSGWIVLAVGLLLLPVPVPMPFPVAAVLMLAGAAILTAHSRGFRHGARQLRHRYGWLSRGVDTVSARAPERVQKLVHRTRPDLIDRHARRRATRAGI